MVPANLTRSSSIRAAILVALGATLVLLIILLPRGESGSGEPGVSNPDPTPSAPRPLPPQAEPVAWRLVTDADGRALADRTVQSAVSELLARETLQVRGRSDLSGTIETFTVDIDWGTAAFASVQTVGSENGIEATIEKIETPEAVFIRVLGDTPEQHGPWNEIPVSVPEQREIESAYTLFGRITPRRLADLAVMWQELNLEVHTATKGGMDGVRLVARSDDVSRYIRDNELAGMQPSDEIGATSWQLWIQNGQLVRLEARGVQFFTGEPFRNVVIDVDYVDTVVSVNVPTL
jgi:hypothetical protein